MFTHKHRAAVLRWFASVSVAGLCAGAGVANAAAFTVPNHSFESPQGPFPVTGVSTSIDIWQQSPQPVWYDPDAFGVDWDSLSGIFPNSPEGDARHIENADGNQVAYFFAVPEVAISQQLTDTFDPGLAYTLTVGLRGGGGLQAGDTFLVGLFYLDGGVPTMVATTPVTATAGYATSTMLNEIQVNLPTVQPGDDWAGQNIGITLAVTSLNTSGGLAYWEADNVRLTAVPEPETYALVAGGILLGGAVWRRCRRSS